MSISELCREIDNLDNYKASIKNTYLELKSIQDKSENEAKKKAEFETKISKVNEIITTKLMSQLGDIQKNYSIADYDTFLKTARDTSYKKSASLPKGNKVTEINAEKKSAKYSIRSPCMIF